MNKILTVVFCAFIPLQVSAQVVITEVMYDLQSGSDSGREWIEVLNSGSVPVDITELRLFENGTNHKITATGNSTLIPGTYAVVADNAEKFKADWPIFAGQLYDSAFSLSNEGETVTLRDGKSIDIDSATFASGMGGDGTGDSLQRSRSGAVLAAGEPTPGAGIPAAGLQKSPPKQTKSSTKKATAAIASAPSEIIGESSKRELQTAGAAAAAPADPSLFWWLAPLMLGVVCSAGIVWSRHLKKDEWEIIEEIPETS